MIILIKLVGVLMMALGLTIFASPKFTQRIFTFFKQGKNIYYAGVIRTALALVLFMCASKSTVPLAVIAIGLMFLVSGIVVFAADLGKLKNFIAAYSEMPELVIRLFGLVAASFGILIVSIF